MIQGFCGVQALVQSLDMWVTTYKGHCRLLHYAPMQLHSHSCLAQLTDRLGHTGGGLENLPLSQCSVSGGSPPVLMLFGSSFAVNHKLFHIGYKKSAWGHSFSFRFVKSCSWVKGGWYHRHHTIPGLEVTVLAWHHIPQIIQDLTTTGLHVISCFYCLLCGSFYKI